MAMSPFRQRLLLPLLLLSCPFLSLLLPLCFADPRTSQAALICGNATAPGSSRQAFISSFLAAMDGVTPQISSRRYARVVAGASANDTVYAFGQCMKDLSESDCDLCFATCKTQILRCLPFQKTTRAGRNFLDGCYLRYDDYEFFGEALSGDDKFVCGAQAFAGNQTAFASNARELVQKLTAEAPSNGGFLVASIEQGNSSVYGLGQCWEFVNRSSCSRCLLNASAAIATCIPREEGRVLNAGCYMRYSTTRFYNNSGTDTTTSGGGNHRAIALAAASSAVAAVMIAGLTLFFGKRKYAQKKKERKQLGALASTVRKSKINFKYETLERATDYFSHTNKLGQGGSGSVFKGLLSDGKAIAVKRLFFNTRQWVDQFFNEVNLISGMDHKNLVKLLGCSINGPESLLVYEFVPNKSLHHYLSDVENSKLLNWEMRFNIILGTAEGLAYLHEESSLRIIHRDIKLSNILLDENYHAKIADFGLARLFPEDRSHISTAIAGTLGYMAPEYIVRGKLTEKADVFSFGILVVELITGKRNNTSQDPLSALQTVWNLHSLHKLWEAVDPILEGKYPVEKASRALHIGLLCSQASPELRPAMSLVVKMLKDEDPIPEPTQPPFLCSSREIALAAAAKSSSPYRSSTHSSDNSTTITIVEPR